MASGEQPWGARMGGRGGGKVLDDTSNPGTRNYVIREDWSVSQETGRYIPKVMPAH